MLEVYFMDVGCGNMTLIKFPNGTTWLYDCNLTAENENAVLRSLKKAMGTRTKLDAFVCSHRDADHMRGVRKVHRQHPIGKIWDADVPGTSTDTPEYRDYMDLRRTLGSRVIEARKYEDVGESVARWMNGKWADISDVNDQSIVLKLEFKGSSVLLAGDTSRHPWKDKILTHYDNSKLSSNILLGSHHGSMTFFKRSGDSDEYTSHIAKIKPAMSILSVGKNAFGFPEKRAVELYEQHSTGSSQGNKVFRTDQKGNMRLELKGNGDWSLSTNQ